MRAGGRLLMHRQQRLRRRQDFAGVYRDGTPFASGPLVLRVRPNPETATPRFGFAVGKRLGGAVARNRIKRQLRDLVQRSGAQGGVDVVVIARASAVRASYREFEAALTKLLARAGRTTQEPNDS